LRHEAHTFWIGGHTGRARYVPDDVVNQGQQQALTVKTTVANPQFNAGQGDREGRQRDNS
jgi:hypothetical protein